MKLLVVQGSYHRDGKTVGYVREVIKGFEAAHTENQVS